MTQDVRQWLAEIKHLQQKLADARQERDEAYAGAANWRKLYETEAQQRRTEANLARQTIESLKAELQELQSIPQLKEVSPEQLFVLKEKTEHLGAAELKHKLVETLLECDRLTKALKIEQENHAQTRNGLTTALGDTVDLLTRERSTRNGGGTESHPAVTSGSSLAGFDGSKTP